ncbi:MAG TPA: hypothetical protein VM204_03310 [Gaiellaceae bacterium]|nr:hypothetical protein [Gaiellaceae bacterium]
MDAAATHAAKPGAAERLLEHCAALDDDRRRPSARARLEALLGSELARRLVTALQSR